MVVVVVVVGVVAGVVVGVVGSVGGCVGVGVVVVSSGLGVENWQCSYTLLGQSHTGPSRPWYLTQRICIGTCCTEMLSISHFAWTSFQNIKDIRKVFTR